MDKSTVYICWCKIDQAEVSPLMSNFFYCFGFGGISLFLLCAFLALVRLSVILKAESDFYDVTGILGMRNFWPISLSMF